MDMLSNRNEKILQILYRANGFVTSHEIAEQLGISVRTVQYTLRDLEDWARKEQVRLEIKPKLGIRLLDKEKAVGFFTQTAEQNENFLSGETRVWISILSVLNGIDGTRVVTLMQKFQASKTTVLKDLAKAESYFEERSLKLQRTRNGLLLPLEEKARRKEMLEVIHRNFPVEALAEYIFSSDYTLVSHSGNERQKAIWNFFDMHKLKELKEGMYYILEALGMQFGDMAFIDNLLWVLITLGRVQKGQYLPRDEKADPDRFPTEYRVVQETIQSLEQKYRVQFPEQEVRYLAYRIAVSQKAGNAEAGSRCFVNEFLEILNDICRKEFNRSLSENPEVVQNLKIHLQMALQRARYGITSYNPLLDKIRTQYPMSYLISETAAHSFERQKQVQLSADEVAYIATYVELALGELEERENSKIYRAVVVCSMGFATSKILSLKIENEFPNIRVIDQLSVALISRYDFTAIDLVFSTVDVRVMLAKPMLLINPMLTGEDVRRINEYLLADSGEKLKKMQYQQILELLNRKEATDMDEVVRGIRSIMGITGEESKLKTLLELMPQKFCQAGVEAETWEEGVWIAAESLIREQYIRESYICEIIRVNREYNNFYLMGEQLSMPHAAPSAGVLRLAFSMATLKKPVKVPVRNGKTAEVRVILILAAVDMKQHAGALEEVADIFDRQDAVERLLNSQSSENLYKVLQEISGNFLDAEMKKTEDTKW